MGEMHTMDEAPVIEVIRGVVGPMTDDEMALVRALTPASLTRCVTVELLFDLVDVLTAIRRDEALAEYIYAIAPGWDGSIEALLLAGRVTTTLNRYELARCVAPRG